VGLGGKGTRTSRRVYADRAARSSGRGMPHVAVDEEREAGGNTSPSDHALIPGNAQWCQALAHEHIDRPHTLGHLTLQPAQSPQLLAADRMDAGLPALGAAYVQLGQS
jgi:hypothetical protein